MKNAALFRLIPSLSEVILRQNTSTCFIIKAYYVSRVLVYERDNPLTHQNLEKLATNCGKSFKKQKRLDFCDFFVYVRLFLSNKSTYLFTNVYWTTSFLSNIFLNYTTKSIQDWIKDKNCIKMYKLGTF